MNYAQIRKFDVANGPGVRTTVFFSGCTHNCPDCFNKQYQKFNYGQEWTEESEDELINNLLDPNVKGLSILGGEPFQQSGFLLYCLVRRVKEETGKEIWLWTGYTFDNIPEEHKPSLQYLDVIVDGRFEREKKDFRLKFRGSSNQRVIDVPKTLEKKEVVLLFE